MDSAYILIISSLLCSAFFSAMELAYISANRLRIEVLRNNQNFQGKILALFYRKESNMIAFLLLGNNVALVLYGIAAGELLNPALVQLGLQDQGLIMVVQTVLSTLVVLITAEFLPKAIVQLNPNKALDLGLVPLLLLYVILYLPTQFIMLISSGFLKLLGSEKDHNKRVFSKVDLENYVDELSANLSDEQEFGNDMLLLRNALDFSHVKARDCMIPRPEIIALDINDSIDEAKTLMISKGLSKLIIYRDDIDNIIGYIHSFDLFKQPDSIKQILKPISFVPTVVTGKELMEIEDEHDKEALTEVQVSENEYLFSARIDIDYLNEAYGFGLEESEAYDTLAGLILEQLERLPAEGDRVQIGACELVIEKVSERKIETVRLFHDN